MSLRKSYRTLSTRQKRAALAALLFLGVLVRLACVLPGVTASHDAQIYSEWGQIIHAKGLENAYEGSTVDYPPFLLYIIGAAASLDSTTSPPDPNHPIYQTPVTLTLELASTLADLLTACLLAAFIWRRSPGLATLTAALYLFNPVTFYLTAFWGQTDSIYTLFMVAALFSIERRALLPAWLLFAVSLATKLQSISLLPLMFVWSLARHGIRGLISGLALGCATIAIVFSPWLLSGHALSLLRPYTTPGEGRVVISAYNAWYLLVGGNLKIPSSTYPLGLPFSYHDIGNTAFILLAALISWLAFKHKGSLALPAALLALTLFLVLTDIHERHSYPVIPFLLWSAADQTIRLRDHNPALQSTRPAGLWLAYSILTLTSFLNIFFISPFTTIFGPSILVEDPVSPRGIFLKGITFAIAGVNILLFLWLIRKLWPANRHSHSAQLQMLEPNPS